MREAKLCGRHCCLLPFSLSCLWSTRCICRYIYSYMRRYILSVQGAEQIGVSGDRFLWANSGVSQRYAAENLIEETMSRLLFLKLVCQRLNSPVSGQPAPVSLPCKCKAGSTVSRYVHAIDRSANGVPVIVYPFDPVDGVCTWHFHRQNWHLLAVSSVAT
jgi:hypothetical protein